MTDQACTKNATSERSDLPIAMSVSFPTRAYSSTQRIEVAVRVRPLLAGEGREPCITPDCKRNEIQVGTQAKRFKFDWVAPADTSQEEMFLKIGMSLADQCLAGYNGTAFAYGQTGSGKTFTMIGPWVESVEQQEYALRGLIPRTLDFMFSQVERATQISDLDCKLHCSFYEIYNEEIFDLLQPSGAMPLTARENPTSGPFVSGLSTCPIASAPDAQELLLAGNARRRVGSTQMNRESSRSHSVFTVYLEQNINDDGIVTTKRSKLNLVDLAGSERQTGSGAEGAQLREANSINRSLTVLGTVIRGLADQAKGVATHLPYRDSKLTYLLRESLGGNSRTWFIANISASPRSFGETFSTLTFAARAAQVITRATVNEDSSKSVDSLRTEVKSLRYQLEQAEATVTALRDSTERRSSVRLSGFSTALLSPNPIAAPSTAATQNLRNKLLLLSTEHSRLKRDVETSLAKASSARDGIEARDSVIQQLKFIAQLCHGVSTVYKQRLKRGGVEDEKLDTLYSAAKHCKALLADHDPSLPARLHQEVKGLKARLAAFEPEYQQWLTDHKDPVQRLQATTAALTDEIQELAAEKQALRDELDAVNSKENQTALAQSREDQETIVALREQVETLETELTQSHQEAQATARHESAAVFAMEEELARHRSRSEETAKKLGEMEAQRDRVQAQLADSKTALERRQQECASLMEHNEMLEAEADFLRQQSQELEQTLNATQTTSQRQRTRIAELEEAMALSMSSEEFGDMSQQLASAEDARDALQAEVEGLCERAEAMRREHESVVASLRADLDMLQSQAQAHVVQAQAKDDALSEAMEKVVAAERLQEAAVAQVDTLKDEIESLNQAVRKAEEARESAAASHAQEVNEFEAQVEQLKADMAAAQANTSQREEYLDHVIEDLRADLQSAFEDKDILQGDLDTLTDEMYALAAEKRALEEAVDSVHSSVQLLSEGESIGPNLTSEDEVQDRLLMLISNIASPASSCPSPVSRGPFSPVDFALSPDRPSLSPERSTPPPTSPFLTPAKPSSLTAPATSSSATGRRAAGRWEEIKAALGPVAVGNDALRAELQELRTFRRTAERELSSMRAEAEGLVSEIASRDGVIDHLQEELATLTEKAAEASVTKRDLDLVREQSANLQTDLNRQKTEAEAMVTEHRAVKARLESEITALRAKVSKADSTIENLRQAEANATATAVSLRSERNILEEETARLRMSVARDTIRLSSRVSMSGASAHRNFASPSRNVEMSPSKFNNEMFEAAILAGKENTANATLSPMTSLSKILLQGRTEAGFPALSPERSPSVEEGFGEAPIRPVGLKGRRPPTVRSRVPPSLADSDIQ